MAQLQMARPSARTRNAAAQNGKRLPDPPRGAPKARRTFRSAWRACATFSAALPVLARTLARALLRPHDALASFAWRVLRVLSGARPAEPRNATPEGLEVLRLGRSPSTASTRPPVNKNTGPADSGVGDRAGAYRRLQALPPNVNRKQWFTTLNSDGACKLSILLALQSLPKTYERANVRTCVLCAYYSANLVCTHPRSLPPLPSSSR